MTPGEAATASAASGNDVVLTAITREVVAYGHDSYATLAVRVTRHLTAAVVTAIRSVTRARS